MEPASRDSVNSLAKSTGRLSRNSVISKKPKTSKLEPYYPLFNKDPALRSPQENRKLIRIVESLTFFNKDHLSMIYQNGLMDSLLNALRYEAFDPSKAIYHEGDASNSFYIVLKGKVRLYIPRSQEEIDQDRRLVQHQNLNTPTSSYQKNLTASSPKIANKTKSSWFQKKDSSTLLRPPSISTFGSNPKPSNFTTALSSHPTDNIAISLGYNSPQTNKSSNLPRWFRDKSNNVSANHSRNNSGVGDMSKPKVENNQLLQSSRFKKNLSKLSVVTSFSSHLRSPSTSSSINSGISLEDQQILSQISKLNRKYVLHGGVCKFRAHRDLDVGDSFGDITNKANARQETAVAIESLHVLTLSAEDYLEIFEEPIRERKERIGIFRMIFSDDQNDNFLTRFAELFQAKKYEFKDIIYHQGTPVGGLFMITKGEVRIVKTEAIQSETSQLKVPKSSLHKLEIARLAPYQFFGAEELLGLETRIFTAECASMELEVLALDHSFISEPFFYTKGFLATITEMCQVQHQWEMEHLNEIKERIYGKTTSTNEKNNFMLKREYQPVYTECGVKKNLDEKYKIRRIKPPTALTNKHSSINDSDSMFTILDQNAKTSINLNLETRSQTPIQTLPRTANEFSAGKNTSRLMDSFVLYRDTSESMNFELKVTKRKEIEEEEPISHSLIPVGSKTSLWKRNIKLVSPRMKHTNISPFTRFKKSTGNLNLTQGQSSRLENINSVTAISTKREQRSLAPLQSLSFQRAQLSSREMQIASPILVGEQTTPVTTSREFIKNKLKMFLHAVNNQPSKRYIKGIAGTNLIEQYVKQLKNKDP